eukprot:jgi/Mesvir1/26778/Mv20549-RA.2
MVKAVVSALDIPVFVLIRCRGGDFVYTKDEMTVMREDIMACAALGARGAVFGALTEDGDVDEDKTGELLRLCGGLALDATFHRAFDQARRPEEALETLIRVGVKRVLSSGQAATAADGMALLKSLNEQANGRITLMAGGGLSEANAASFVKIAGIREVHGTLRTQVASKCRQWNPACPLSAGAVPSERHRLVTDAEKVRAAVAAIAQMSSG